MCFGKSGGRCKSLQCWIMSRTCVAMKRGVFVLLSRVSLFALVRSVCGRGNHPPLVVHSRGGWGVSAHQPISDPWLISGAPWRDDCETEALLKKQNKKTQHLWRSFPRKPIRFFKNVQHRSKSEQASWLLTSAPRLRSTWCSGQSPDRRRVVSEAVLVSGRRCLRRTDSNLQWHNASRASQATTQGHDETAALSASCSLWPAPGQNMKQRTYEVMGYWRIT